MKSYDPREIGNEELAALAEFARREHDAFFVRNPGSRGAYEDRLIAAALCQGAALHYLGRGKGVHDFDVHLFYSRAPAKPRLSRTVKSVIATVGKFTDFQVDFVRTVIPASCGTGDPVETVRRFLAIRPTANARHLAQKAVIGLFPRELLGSVIWPVPERTEHGTENGDALAPKS